MTREVEIRKILVGLIINIQKFWRLYFMKKNSTPYEFEGRIPLMQAIPLGLQHVMAMFIGNLTPLIIVMGLCGLTADAGYGALRTALLQNAMIMAGIVTLVQMFSIATGRR